MAASLHLPVRPKTDLVLLYGLANLLIQNGWIDRQFIDAHTSGFEEFAAFVRPLRRRTRSPAKREFEPTRSSDTGRARFMQAPRVSFWWTMGVNQSHQGVKNGPGDDQPGTHDRQHRPARHRAPTRSPASATRWARGCSRTRPTCSAATISPTQTTAPRLPRVLRDPRGTNSRPYKLGVRPDHGGDPVRQNPRPVGDRHQPGPLVDQSGRACATSSAGSISWSCRTCTTRPRRPGWPTCCCRPRRWGEKEGTFINSERRIGLIKKVRRAPGQRLADFHIFKLVAHYYGCESMFGPGSRPRQHSRSSRRLSAGMPCDITGITDYRMLDEAGGIQWPYPRRWRSCITAQIVCDGRFYHADGRARFIFEEPRPTPEPPRANFRFNFSPAAAVPRNGTRRRAPRSRTCCESSSQRPARRDPSRRCIGIGCFAAWAMAGRESRRGQARVRAFDHPDGPAGQPVPSDARCSTNLLTDSVFDPESRQPAYKARCAVRIQWSGQPEPASNGPDEASRIATRSRLE